VKSKGGGAELRRFSGGQRGRGLFTGPRKFTRGKRISEKAYKKIRNVKKGKNRKVGSGGEPRENQGSSAAEKAGGVKGRVKE